MPETVVHIGTEKTGTSTIQSFLARNAENLAASGVLYPRSPRGPDAPSHLKLAAFALSDKRREGDLHDKLKIASVPDFRKALDAALLEEVANSQCKTVVLSSEHLSSRLHSVEEIGRLKGLIDKIGPAKIILYLRPQYELVASAYSTRVRLGGTTTFEDFIKGGIKGDLYNYKNLCMLWESVFGRSALKVRIFDRTSFHNGSLLEDFLHVALPSLSIEDMFIPESENESLSGEILEFIRQFNHYLPHMGPQTNFMIDPRQGNLLRILGTMNGRRKPRIRPELADRLQAEFEESNRYVAETYLGWRDRPLFEAGGAGSVDPRDLVGQELSVKDAFRIFAKAWEMKVAGGAQANAGVKKKPA